MDKETAISVWTTLERVTYERERSTNIGPDEGEEGYTRVAEEMWVVTEAYPVYEIRLDAGTDVDEERDFRIFLRVASGVPTEQVADEGVWAIGVVKDAGCDVAFENAGLAIT